MPKRLRQTWKNSAAARRKEVSAMHLTKSKSAPVMWFVTERGTGTESIAHLSHKAAMADFTAALVYADHAGEGYTPYDRGRRLVVTGPDWVMQPEDHTDPLPVADVALKAVLTPAEYSLIVHGTVASALLES